MKVFSSTSFLHFSISFLFCLSSTTNYATENLTSWDLTDLFKSEQDWKKKIQEQEDHRSKIKACKGRLGHNSTTLLACLNDFFYAKKELARVSIWASLQQTTDLKNNKFNEYVEVIRHLDSKFRQESSYITPELILLGEKNIDKLTNEKKKNFEPYSLFLEDVIRQSRYTLSSKEESLISAFSTVLEDAVNTRNLLYTADIAWNKVRLSDGKEIIADDNGYTQYRSSNNRSDRKKVFEAFYHSLKQFERTFGSTLGREVQVHVIDAKQRGYNSALERALSPANLPPSVYHTLVAEVNTGLPTLHRYLKLRARMINVSDLQYHDNYPDLVKNDQKYDLTKSREIFLSGIKVLGEDYFKKATHATHQKWIEAYPKEGKSGGAYMSGGAYDVHPYIFLNHQDDFDSAMTYAHEWGHGLHTLYANESQPFSKADYPTFTAEIASTVNEALVLKDILSKTTNPSERLYFLGHELEFIRTTFFRQTQLAEFELKIHEIAERGDPLTGEKMSALYGEIVRRYYGHKEKVMFIDDRYNLEWAFIPHFYYNFYVYQYATSVAAGYFFVEQILKGDASALTRYLNLLKGGGSLYPYDLVKNAGLDMKKPDAYRSIIQRANVIMDEMENLIKQIE